MFERISESMKNRMRYLEEIDTKEREDGTAMPQQLRQIPPETGKFLAMVASNCPHGRFIEIGTGAGYSTLWLSLACMERNIKIKTFEISPEKAKLAKETFNEAKISDFIELVEGNALDYLGTIRNISFCFLDAEKDIYESCYDLIIPRMVKGGLFVADNAVSHYKELKPMIDRALADNRVDTLIVPIGKGELICRKKQ